MIYEDDVVNAVAAHLRADGWSIVSTALATQPGDDLVATRDGQQLIVEAKGQGSSKPGTARFGDAFTRGQVGKHVANAVLRAMRVVSEGTSIAAIALPNSEHHRREVDQVRPALTRLGIRVYLVNAADDVDELE